MSAVAQAPACTCDSVGAPQQLRLCQADGHYRFWSGDKRLTGVSTVINYVWPKTQCERCGGVGYNHGIGCPVGERIENARERGKVVDELFAKYISREYFRGPARSDAVALYHSLVEWWVNQPFATWDWIAQHTVHNGEIVGVIDLYSPTSGMVLDLKTVYELDPKYGLQVAGYADVGRLDGEIGCIHLSKKGVRLLKYGDQERADWSTARSMWHVVKRRARKFEADDESED